MHKYEVNVTTGESVTIQLTQDEIDKVNDDAASFEAGAPQREIERLEGLETPRRMAEATLTGAGKQWLQSNRDLIAKQRALL
jgi:hypothetical protein